LAPPDEEQLPTVSPTRTRIKEPDEACAKAVDLAAAAAHEIAGPGQVGPHLGVQADGDRVVTHFFACEDPAYTGWHWAITVARASRAKVVTVSEGVLLPGPGSLLPPDWVPWSERVRPGDVGVGDLLPVGQDDERLVPAVLLEGDDGILDWDDAAGWEAGQDLLAGMKLTEAAGAGSAIQADAAARAGTAEDAAALAAAATAAAVAATTPSRVLSAIGRDSTADRWYSGEHGPHAPLASAAPAPCVTCGFLVRLDGPLGRVFGVCANEYAPDDGKVVSVDHGCGAHSEAETPAGPFAGIGPAASDPGYDLVDAPGISMADTVFEPLG
jgi:Protein of unknown function (DUF3027)